MSSHNLTAKLLDKHFVPNHHGISISPEMFLGFVVFVIVLLILFTFSFLLAIMCILRSRKHLITAPLGNDVSKIDAQEGNGVRKTSISTNTSGEAKEQLTGIPMGTRTREESTNSNIAVPFNRPANEEGRNDTEPLLQCSSIEATENIPETSCDTRTKHILNNACQDQQSYNVKHDANKEPLQTETKRTQRNYHDSPNDSFNSTAHKYNPKGTSIQSDCSSQISHFDEFAYIKRTKMDVSDLFVNSGYNTTPECTNTDHARVPVQRNEEPTFNLDMFTGIISTEHSKGPTPGDFSVCDLSNGLQSQKQDIKSYGHKETTGKPFMNYSYTEDETQLKQVNSSEHVNRPDQKCAHHCASTKKHRVPHPNKRIYELLKKMDWVQGYYSEGASITVYVNLEDITMENALKVLATKTGESTSKFNIEPGDRLND